MHVCFLVFSHALLSLVYCVYMQLRLTGEEGWCVGVFYLSSAVLKRPALIWCYYNKREDSLLPATSCTHLFKMNSTKSDSYFPNPVFCLVLSNQRILLLKDLILLLECFTREAKNFQNGVSVSLGHKLHVCMGLLECAFQKNHVGLISRHY